MIQVDGKMIPVDGKVMEAIAPRFTGPRAENQAQVIAGIGPILADTLAKYDINSKLRIAHFLAQTCHESAGFSTLVERASGTQYESRSDLGNGQPGDGVRYKGRGLLFLTGRANYREYGKALKIDLEAEPERAAEPEVALKTACEYWKRRKLNEAADSDDVVRVTKKINGGLSGLSDRDSLLIKAKEALEKL